MIQSSPYFEQSAVIPYRLKNEQLQVLLITNRKGKRWIIPKGLIETYLTPQESAAKEAYEEAGIRGKVLPDLWGIYYYEKWGGVCRVQVFLLEVETLYIDWLEASFRQRQWFQLEAAIKVIQETEIKQMLEKLETLV